MTPLSGPGPGRLSSSVLVIILLATIQAPAAAQAPPDPLVFENAEWPEVPRPTLDIPLEPTAEPMDPERNRGRNDAMLNGALIALGALGIFDNVVVHWILGWHRAIEDSPHALEIEIGIVAISAAALVTGVVRERRARQEQPR